MSHLIQRIAVFSLATLASIHAYAAVPNDQRSSKTLAFTAAAAPNARVAALVGAGAITRSKGVLGFTHPSTGQYCFQPVATIKITPIVPVVSVDWSTSSGSGLFAFYRSTGNGCPTGNISILTYTVSAGADPVLSDNVGFTLLVP